MSYLVLARKYRPQTFEEVVGQSHVTTTLANAITSGRLAHAILFSGPRGTGKTTVARILAKTVNCETNRETPSAVPCNVCRSCMEITSGSAVDVFEIDGASNNSVDQVRELRDNVRYMPAHSPYKIYIIDEVHMLSLAAFNALLKTLEEPPAHVKFMFATTEAHKIPVTILSRCQRHDMRRVDMDLLTTHLASLCVKEGVTVEEKSLALIAQESGGSVRDSLSLLDQVMGSTMGEVSHDQVLSILGTVDRQNIFDLSDAILSRDIPMVLDLIDGIYDRGHDLKKLYARITEHFRNLLVVKITKDSSRLVDVTGHEREQMAAQVKNASPLYLTQILDLLFAEEPRIRYAVQPRFALEMTLIKILQVAPALSIDTLIEKLDQLQAGVQPEYPAQNGPARTGQRNTESYRSNTQAGSPPAPTATHSVNESLSSYPTAQTASHGQPGESHQPNRQDSFTAPQQGNQPHHQDYSERQTQPVSSGFNPSESKEQSWARFLGWFSPSAPQLMPCLDQSALKELAEKTMVVEIGGTAFNLQRLSQNKSKTVLEQAMRNFFRNQAVLNLVSAAPAAMDSNRERKERNDHIKQETLNNPVVSEAMKIFDGNVDITIL